jgi:hypothetical protein
MNAADADAILGTDRAVSIRADFGYFDLEGNRHETTICLSKLLTGAIQYCAGSYIPMTPTSRFCLSSLQPRQLPLRFVAVRAAATLLNHGGPFFGSVRSLRRY